MILVSVGTHEQPFDRLLREVDRLAECGSIDEEVFCQTGYSTYRPRVPSAAMVTHGELQDHLRAARVVITHGGPATVLAALALRRPLILVPRQRRYGEHVDNHQVAFCERFGRERGLPVVLEISDLEAALQRPGDPGALEAGAAPGAERLRQLVTELLGRTRT